MTTITLSGGAAMTDTQKTALRVEIGAASAADVSTAVAAHVAAADPHPQYLTQAEGDALYAPTGISGTTNLTAAPSPTGVTINSDTGTDAVIPLADGTNAGVMAPAQVTKLAELTQVSVINDLTTGGTSAALSAEQGKTLKTQVDGKATAAQGAKADSALQPGAKLTQAAVTAATAAGVALLDAIDAAAQRTALGLGTAATSASTAFASAAQGAKADAALQPGAQLTQTAVTSATAAGVALLGAADAAAQRTALGLGTAATTAATAYATAAQGARADAAMPNTAGAMATTLEAAAIGAPADLARIKASVSKASADAGNMLTSGSDGQPMLTPPSFRDGLNYASLIDREALQADVAIQVTPERYADLVVGGDWGPAIAAAVAELAALGGSAHDGPAPVAGSYALRAAARGAVVLGFGRHYPTNQTITLSKSVGLIAHGSSLTAGPLLPSGAYILDTTNTWDESWDGKISGLTINGANRPVKGARFRRAQGAWVTDLEVGGCLDDGITVVEGYELIMTNAIVWAGQGVAAGKCGLRIEGADSHYTNCISANYAFGFLLNGAKNNFFTNCHGWGVHTAGYRCRVPFYLTASSSGNTFTGVYADSPSKLDYAAGTAFTVQADGYINGGVGIYIDASCADNGFSGVRIIQNDSGLSAAGVSAAAHNFPIVLTSSSGNQRFNDVRIAGSGYWAVTHIAYSATAPYTNPFIRNNTLSIGVSNARMHNSPLPVLTPLLYQKRKDYGAAGASISVFPDTAISALSVSGATTVGLDQLSVDLDYILIQHTIQIFNSSASASTVTWAAGVYAASPNLVIPAGKIASVMFYTTNYGVNWYVQLAVVMA